MVEPSAQYFDSMIMLWGNHTFYQQLTCHGEFWDYDDFDVCHRQVYLELFPLIIVILCALLYWIFQISSLLINHNSVDYTDSEDLENSTTVVTSAGAPDKDARVVIQTRSITDFTRLILEIFLNISQFAVVVSWSNKYSVRESYSYAPAVPLLFVLLSGYSVLLSFYRYIKRGHVKMIFGKPYTQLSYLYSFFVFSFALQALSKTRTTDCLVLFVIASLNWIIIFSSPIGDSAPRLYTSKGSIPSTEPNSSLFRLLSCSWNNKMIFDSQKEQLNMNTVWDLSENDHVFKFMEKANSYSPQWSFVTRLVLTTRKALSLNIFFGCTASFTKLLPTLFIQRILQFLETRSVPNNVAWLYVLGLGLSYLISNVCSNQAFYQGRKLSLGIRSLIIGCVYRKALYAKVKSSHGKSSSEEEGSDGSLTSSSASTKTVKSEDTEDDTFDSSSNGAVINLMSVDSFKVADTGSYLHEIVATPFLVILSIFFLYEIIGWSAFIAVVSMLFLMPFNIIIARRLNAVQDQLMAVTDKRVEKTNELLEAVRIIKFFAWERKFCERVLDIREKELNLLLWRNIYWIANSVVFFIMPMLVVVSSFWCFVRYQGGNLTSSVAFTAISVFNIMRMPLNEVAFLFTDISSTMVSLRRISKYLKDEETPKYKQLRQPMEYINSDGTAEEYIGFENASFKWGTSNTQFALTDINIRFNVGDLNVIVGPTGSGKTSLLLALLGEMPIEKGNVYLPHGDRRAAPSDPETKMTDTVAFCSQEAWLVNDTIKQNILFASDFDKKRYNEVLEVCQLKRDLEILENGDQTLIGDKGISLSGGQKQRVCLARALYSRSKHVILDDCLSAVDSHTAESLYNQALTGVLAMRRTIILVSHNVALTIGKASQVIVLQNGRVKASGSPAEVSAAGFLGKDELISRSAQLAESSRTASAVDLAAMNTVDTMQNVLAHGVDDIDIGMVEDVEDAKHADEERAVGNVPLTTYIEFISQLANKRGIFLAALFGVLVPCLEYVETWWTKVWAGDMGTIETRIYGLRSFILSYIPISSNEIDDEKLAQLRYYSLVYILIGCLSVFVAITREFIVYYGGLRASKKIFRRLLTSVVRAKTRFFDSTPSGRIMNRFSKDMEVIDQEIGANLLWLLISLLDALQVALVVSWVTPLLIPMAILVLYLFVLIAKAYLSAARELKRLESITRSPIFQQFSETLTGSIVIRAYDDTRRFVDKNWASIDLTHRPYFWLWISNRWLSFWCSMLSLVISVSAASCIVWTAGVINPGMAGISLSFSTYFGDCILWVVRMYAQCEVSMNSVERVYEYLDIEQEAPAIIPESRPPASWPTKGEIKFNKLSLRYNDDLPLVIKDVSFDVAGGEKVGVVGRTGAGKSTIITALFRMLEPCSGSIVIDDIDICSIGLEDLRKNISIIPQDPTLFKGTLRSNLDLFGEYTDAKIFKALASVHLVPKGTTPESASQIFNAGTAATEGENVNQFFNLDLSVSEGGQNLSQGQRQLLCLARAILREPRILLLDEATASIDYDTDATIQQTIRQSFGNTTILTIAHRLRTIADYDKILVLDKGCVAEFDHPANLLANNNTLFYSMCERSGELDILIKIANDAQKKYIE